MQMASSANCTCMELASASEYTATVRMLSSLQARMIRTAISPRLATRTFSNIRVFRVDLRLNGGLSRPELEEGLAKFDGLGVFEQDLGNNAFGLRLNLVHHLHGFDNAHHGVRVHLGANFHVGSGL